MYIYVESNLQANCPAQDKSCQDRIGIMATLERTAGSLHSRIVEDIRARIVDGGWRPGFQIPKETDLAQAYGVSRMTMNKALTLLAQEGYLVRRKRSGTFVAHARTQSAALEISNISNEVSKLGREYSWKLINFERRRLQQSDLRVLGVMRGSIEEEAIFLQGVHFAGAEPFCLETRAINVAAVPMAAEMDFSVNAPGIWLLQSMPWSAARHVIRAVNATGRDASLLDLPLGSACLEMLRETRSGGNWITYARLLYPGEAHQLVAEFEPQAGAEVRKSLPEA